MDEDLRKRMDGRGVCKWGKADLVSVVFKYIMVLLDTLLLDLSANGFSPPKAPSPESLFTF